jgi:hypothetical protein
MFSTRHLTQLLALAVAAPLLAVGCSSETKTKTVTVNAPRVVVSGEFAILVGGTAQLTATTADGTDAGYTWTSSDAAIATVDAAGLVTGVFSGPVTITATGATTGAAGAYNMVVSTDVPFLTSWMGSAHARITDEAFRHWDADGEIPTDCARCHATPGYIDYLGGDGSAAFVVDAPAPLGTVVSCQACHNQAAQVLSQVTFPSGATLTGLGPEARCMTCHQGREATDTVDAQIAAAAVTSDDEVNAGLGFRNIHYYAAGATLNAGRVRGGYQYAGKVYDWRFRHVPGLDTCVGCHDKHSLAIDPARCATCHTGVATLADLRGIRMQSSLAVDYDGDGDLAEGIAGEIDGVRAKLLQGLQAYVTAQALTPICYSGAAYPYFFNDTNADGSCDAAEAVFGNRYATFTARLERATYNYQVSLKDPGAFAHNAKYIIEIMFDSIEDLNAGIPAGSQVDQTAMRRTDFGHFNGAGEPARHWDADEAVSASCSKCHAGSDGIAFFLKHGVGDDITEPDNGLDCLTCHTAFPATAAAPNLRVVSSATFPSGRTVTAAGTGLTTTSMLCMTCHMGRESKATVDANIAGGSISFRNVHYFAAGATLLGSDAQVGYEYAGQTYAAKFTHTGGNDCNACHNGDATKHTFMASDNLARCQLCHGGAASTHDIRLTHVADYDGDGSTTEPLAGELAGLQAAVLASMQASAAICYSGSAYPYFFKDTNADGTCDATEAVRANGFSPWTAPLAKAAFNYQFVEKDPGAFAHNFTYAAQLLYDSVVDLGGDTTGLVRP